MCKSVIPLMFLRWVLERLIGFPAVAKSFEPEIPLGMLKHMVAKVFAAQQSPPPHTHTFLLFSASGLQISRYNMIRLQMLISCGPSGWQRWCRTQQKRKKERAMLTAIMMGAERWGDLTALMTDCRSPYKLII